MSNTDVTRTNALIKHGPVLPNVIIIYRGVSVIGDIFLQKKILSLLLLDLKVEYHIEVLEPVFAARHTDIIQHMNGRLHVCQAAAESSSCQLSRGNYSEATLGDICRLCVRGCHVILILVSSLSLTLHLFIPIA